MASLRHIPPEVLREIVSDLPNRDIKNLRLAGEAVPLRFHRVFLSPNPTDIKILYKVAQHEFYRTLVTELVYDDARFHNAEEPLWNYVERPHHVETAKRLKARLSLRQSFILHQKIFHEQQQVIAEGSDIAALEHAIKRFPNPKRVTLTPAAHGVPFVPFYETPMIRHLPHGFVYPIPYPWPASESKGGAEHTYPPWDNEKEKNKWRGLRIVLDSIARNPHGITEFTVEVNQLRTGLSCRIFDSPNQEYKNLESLLRTPGFSHLDLAISAGTQDDELWPCFHSGLLRDALSEAKDLQHISLSTAMVLPDAARAPEKFDSAGEEHFFPLRSIFPLDQWQNLRHFGLSRFIVKRKDLVHVLCSMPPTLRSVELSFLDFLETNRDHYRELLLDLRDVVNWRARPVSERPKIIIFIDSQPPTQGRCLDISREVENFIYCDGDSPFGKGNGRGLRGCRVSQMSGFGTERDMFNPLNDLPHIDGIKKMDLGILKPDWMYLQGIRPTLKSRKPS